MDASRKSEPYGIWKSNNIVSLLAIVVVPKPTITPESVLVASGHVGEFNDLMTECKACGSIFRADHLVEHLHPNADSLNSEDIDKFLGTGIECPSCSEKSWTPAQPMNLMPKYDNFILSNEF